MTNTELDKIILDTIIATPNCIFDDIFSKAEGADFREVDRALQRLRKRGLIRYNKNPRGWVALDFTHPEYTRGRAEALQWCLDLLGSENAAGTLSTNNIERFYGELTRELKELEKANV